MFWWGFFWRALQVWGKVCQCGWLHAATRIGVLAPLLFVARWPRQVAETTYANACGCMQPPALAYFPHAFQGPPEEAPPEQCSPESSSIQLSLARLGLDGLSAEEVAKLGWAPYVACGHLPLLSNCHPTGTVSYHFH